VTIWCGCSASTLPLPVDSTFALSDFREALPPTLSPAGEARHCSHDTFEAMCSRNSASASSTYRTHPVGSTNGLAEVSLSFRFQNETFRPS
jgi:hypothetical protein